MSVIERFNLKVGDFQLFESPVEKHGTHDQKTHGNWARDNFNEETQGEDAQNLYFDKYGMKFLGDGRKEPVGISEGRNICHRLLYRRWLHRHQHFLASWRK
jgi:hypothetical protein